MIVPLNTHMVYLIYTIRNTSIIIRIVTMLLYPLYRKVDKLETLKFQIKLYVYPSFEKFRTRLCRDFIRIRYKRFESLSDDFQGLHFA